MSRLVDRLLVCIYLTAAVLPAIGSIRKTPGVEIFGSVPQVAPPPVSWDAITHEKTQRGFVAWFERYIGYRGISTHTDNAVLFHVFGETKPGAGVMIGRGGVLYQSDDLSYYSQRPDEVASAEAIDAFADKIARAQVRLAATGRTLVPLVIPSKTSVYPDHVPPEWVHDLGEPRPTERLVYRAYRRAFDQRGIRYVDAREILTSSPEPRELIWGHKARHWSAYGACLAMRGVMTTNASVRGAPPVEYPCIAVRQPVWRYFVDYDLLSLLNAWGVAPAQREAPIVIGLAPGVASVAPRPDTLYIGTSFTDTIANDGRRSGLLGEIHFYYYNRSYLEPWPHGTARDIVPRDAEWRRLVASKELFILDLFETYLTPTNFAAEFLNQLLAELDDPTSPLHAPAIP